MVQLQAVAISTPFHSTWSVHGAPNGEPCPDTQPRCPPVRVVTSVHSGLAASASKGVASLGAMGSSSAWGKHAVVVVQSRVGQYAVCYACGPWHSWGRCGRPTTGGKGRAGPYAQESNDGVDSGKEELLPRCCWEYNKAGAGSGDVTPFTGDTCPHPAPGCTAWVS